MSQFLRISVFLYPHILSDPLLWRTLPSTLPSGRRDAARRRVWPARASSTGCHPGQGGQSSTSPSWEGCPSRAKTRTLPLSRCTRLAGPHWLPGVLGQGKMSVSFGEPAGKASASTSKSPRGRGRGQVRRLPALGLPCPVPRGKRAQPGKSAEESRGAGEGDLPPSRGRPGSSRLRPRNTRRHTTRKILDP